MEHIGFLLLGLILGAYGTLIGAGGGFILVPILLWLYPEKEPEYITSIALAVVSVNALSGVLAYSRMGRIDYRTGILFGLASMPGAMLGALATAHVSRDSFESLFGVVLILSSVMLLRRTAGGKRMSDDDSEACFGDYKNTALLMRFRSRRFVIGIGISFGIGFLSSMLGIGGGIFQVPLLAYGLYFPVHIAVATSEFILATKAVAATSVHLFTGILQQGLQQAIMLVIGVSVGAQIGARLSKRVDAQWIIRALAVSLAIVGVQFLL